MGPTRRKGDLRPIILMTEVICRRSQPFPSGLHTPVAPKSWRGRSWGSSRLCCLGSWTPTRRAGTSSTRHTVAPAVWWLQCHCCTHLWWPTNSEPHGGGNSGKFHKTHGTPAGPGGTIPAFPPALLAWIQLPHSPLGHPPVPHSWNLREVT